MGLLRGFYFDSSGTAVTLRRDLKLQLRAEFINVLDEPYFPAPNVGATSNTFGQVTASNQSNYARRAQLGVKITF